jgi:NAD(P)-dependent dehydrogenase (short-subunit alcohol dehydrogenase family)
MNSIRFDDNVIIITGAGQGVGRAYATAFASRGARVVINDLALDEARVSLAQKLADEIGRAGGHALADSSDIATPEGGTALVEAALRRWGKVDVVVHNAGILRDASFQKMALETVHAVLSVHLLGAWHVLQPAFRFMREHDGGRILLTSSASGIFGHFGQSNYAAAKMGLVGLTRVLAQEGAKYNIHTNCISPFAATRLTAGADAPDDAVLAPSHVAAPALVLCHSSCPSNGEVFQTGGGWTGRVVIGLTDGYRARERASAEELLEHWQQVRTGPIQEPPTAAAIADLFKLKLGVANLK